MNYGRYRCLQYSRLPKYRKIHTKCANTDIVLVKCWSMGWLYTKILKNCARSVEVWDKWEIWGFWVLWVVIVVIG